MRLIMILLMFSKICCTSEIKIDKAEMSKKVKLEFLHAWNNYKKYAWGHDALKPLSKGYFDWYGESLLMTPIDAYDTMILMGLGAKSGEAKELILSKLSFDKDIYVSNFEITIRLLGGLLSAYELDGDRRFLNLATDLGDRLLPVFRSRTGMPYQKVNLKTGKTQGEVSNPAEIGTLLMELGTLSKLTNNPVYYNKAKKAQTELFKRRSSIGLVGSTIDVETGEWLGRESCISGGTDAYYEYLLKCWVLFGDEDCKKMWESSIEAVNKYLADSVSTGFWYRQVDMDTGAQISTHFGALDAFFPAVLSLGGDLDRAEKLQKSCFKMWTKFDIEPELMDYGNMKAVDTRYFLRPENIESAYYLYHYTKNEAYFEMGRTYYQSIKKYCRTKYGYAALNSVITKEKDDQMESFFLGETLKYLYLLLAPENRLRFDDIVFNTEAHPLKRFTKTGVSGTFRVSD